MKRGTQWKQNIGTDRNDELKLRERQETRFNAQSTAATEHDVFLVADVYKKNPDLLRM
jgi:hypothetical protein